MFFEGDAGLDYQKQMDIVDDPLEIYSLDLLSKLAENLYIFIGLLKMFAYFPKVQELQKKLEKYVRDKAPEMGVDKSTHSPCQIMRVPGYKHGVTKSFNFFKMLEKIGPPKRN